MNPSQAPRFEPVVLETRQRHLREWLAILWDRRLWALGAFALTIAAVGIFTLLQSKVYKASALVAIYLPQSRVLAIADSTEANPAQYGGILAQERFLNTQYEIIRSHTVLDQVVERSKLRERAPWKHMEDPAEALAAMLRVDTVTNTNVAKIEVRAGSARQAADLANAIAETYVDWNISSKVADFQRVRETLSRELQKGLDEMEKYTARTVDYTRQTNDLPDMDDQLAAAKIQEYETTLIGVRQELNRAQTNLLQARAAARAGIEAALTDPTISKDKTVQDLYGKLLDLENDLASLKTRYLERHEAVQKKMAEVQDARQKLEIAIQAAANRGADEVANLQGQAASLQARIDSERRFVVKSRETRSPLETLERQVTTSGTFLEKMMARLNEVDILPAISQNNVQLIEKADPPEAPSSPKRLLNLVLGLVLGSVFGVSLAFFVDYLDVKVKTTEDVERVLGLPLLAVVPRLGKKTERHAKEAIQSLRTGILFASRSRTHRSILVTSSTPQEGKTFVAVNLSRAFAQAGEKVVILECDFRVPAVSKLLKVLRTPGLSNFLAGAPSAPTWKGVLRETGTPNLFLLPAGDVPPNPPDLLQSAAMTRLLQELRDEFDWVLIDCPPVATMSDAQILGSLVDMVVFVVRHGAVEKPLALRAIQVLKSSNPNIIGAVLNSVDPSRQSFPEYYYGKDYYSKAGAPSTGGTDLVLTAVDGKD